MNKKGYVVIKDFAVEEEKFVIYNDGKGGYWAFNHKDIDKNGKLTKVYNGLSGNYSDKLACTLRWTYEKVMADKYIDNEKWLDGDREEVLKFHKIVEKAGELFPMDEE